jgi:hypothetical protein
MEAGKFQKYIFSCPHFPAKPLGAWAPVNAVSLRVCSYDSFNKKRFALTLGQMSGEVHAWCKLHRINPKHQVDTNKQSIRPLPNTENKA